MAKLNALTLTPRLRQASDKMARAESKREPRVIAVTAYHVQGIPAARPATLWPRQRGTSKLYRPLKNRRDEPRDRPKKCLARPWRRPVRRRRGLVDRGSGLQRSRLA